VKSIIKTIGFSLLMALSTYSTATEAARDSAQKIDEIKKAPSIFACNDYTKEDKEWYCYLL